jgi:CheY-like chemotaxis protein
MATSGQVGGATILVVEDEPMVLSTVAQMLDRLGHAPLAAASPEKALAIAATHTEIDLVLTDLVMPGMNGVELVIRLTALRPAMRWLYMSGYAATVICRDSLLDIDNLPHADRLLVKPFTIESLARKIDARLAPGSSLAAAAA